MLLMENFKVDIGKRIKIARIETDVSQESLAEMLGVSPQTVSAWESGRNQITAAANRALLGLLDAVQFDGKRITRVIWREPFTDFNERNVLP